MKHMISPSKVFVDTSPYKRAQKKAPRGFGMWVFDFVMLDGTNKFMTYTNTYAAARKSAQVDAAVACVSYIRLMD